jgi:hypothetical protein
MKYFSGERLSIIFSSTIVLYIKLCCVVLSIMSYKNSFSKGNVTGIQDGAVRSRICFSVKKNFEFESAVNGSSKEFICFLPGHNMLMEHF